MLAAQAQPETLLATQAESARPIIKLYLAEAPDEAVVGEKRITSFADRDAAWCAALKLGALLDESNAYPPDTPLESFTHVLDANSFSDGTNTWNDAPQSFGQPDSSGVEGRQFAPRRVKVESPKSPVVDTST